MANIVIIILLILTVASTLCIGIVMDSDQFESYKKLMDK